MNKNLWAAAAAVTLATAVSAGAATISVQLTGNVDGNVYTLLPNESTGVIPVSNWNSFDASNMPNPMSNLVDNNGSPSPITATINRGAVNDIYEGAASTPYQKLFFSYASSGNGGATQTVTISNIPDSSYDLYVYFSGGGGWPGTVSQGSTTYYFRTMAGGGTFTPATSEAPVDYTTYTNAPSANYSLFSGLSGSSVTFSVADVAHATDPTYGLQYWPIGVCGFQIVDTSSVPEPASMGLLTAAAGFLIRRRRQG